MSAEKRRLMQLFLRIPTLKPTNKYEIDLRTQLHGYRLDTDPMCNTLWRLRDSGHIKDRQVVSEDAYSPRQTNQIDSSRQAT